ncbi:hypothetical protein ACFY3E_17715 [Streptomyces griseorubiginosus]|uniref:hypothetical protein n=1 Tax=Streptomyces griseorubiginosus TaxID=67304 RepID=UPI00369F5F2E
MTSKAARRRFRRAERLRAFRDTRRRDRWERRRERLRKAAALLVAALIGVILTGYSGLMLMGALGLSGTPGELSVRSCDVVRDERNHPMTECHGELLSITGRLLDASAVLDADAHAGSTVAVRAQPYFGLETLGPRAVVGWATLMLIGVFAVTTGVVIVRDAADQTFSLGPRTLVVLLAAIAAGALVYGLTVLYEHLF